MKTILASLILLTAALHAGATQPSTPTVELRLQQIDLDVALKLYGQLRREFSQADLELALKGSGATAAERAALGKKVETLGRRSGQLQREIRDRSARIDSALKATPARNESIDSRLQKIEMTVAIGEYERVKTEAARVELEQLLQAGEASDPGRKDLGRKSEMLAGRAERLIKEIRERAGRVADVPKESQPKAAASPRGEELAKLAPANQAAPESKAVEAETAKAQQKLDALNAELTKRRKARDEAPEGAEHDAADQRVQATKQEIATARAALEAAKEKHRKP